jgi:RNA recognition motif-containing protein
VKSKLYISNLSNDINETELKHHFSRVGKVTSVAIVRGRYSNASRGIAMLEMETEEGTRMAVAQFNGTLLKDNAIVVSQSKDKWVSRKA